MADRNFDVRLSPMMVLTAAAGVTFLFLVGSLAFTWIDPLPSAVRQRGWLWIASAVCLITSIVGYVATRRSWSFGRVSEIEAPENPTWLGCVAIGGGVAVLVISVAALRMGGGPGVFVLAWGVLLIIRGIFVLRKSKQ
jgi:hypothetical protein